MVLNFYPRPPRGGRRTGLYGLMSAAEISIHALREEGDRYDDCFAHAPSHFYPRPPRGGRRAVLNADRQSDSISIHALREEGDSTIPSGSSRPTVFLSTPSARRATGGSLRSVADHQISIHALREEGDHSHKRYPCPEQNFYPRPPRGGRLPQWSLNRLFIFISIHALREEGDSHIQQYSCFHQDFYPRPPRGGRQLLLSGWRVMNGFLSTPSARRATCVILKLKYDDDEFLSTPSARRATCGHHEDATAENFYPRPPRGGRQIAAAY